ncbi:MAG: glycoside hydrolase family 44 protein [Archangium sp.]|nr:glycoside hydrolase family 44 protein [Archangium sp.]
MKVSVNRWAGAVFAVVVALSACQPMESIAHEAQHSEAVETSTTRTGRPLSTGSTARPATSAPASLDSDTGLVTDAGTALAPGDPGAGDVRFAIDTAAQVRPISRYVYGKNFNGRTWAQEPNLTMNRIGGNRWSAYNWENNASNAGSDFNDQSDGYLGGGSTPGEAVRMNVEAARNAGGSILVTVPMLGWVAADKLATSVRDQPITSRFVQTRPVKGAAFVYPPNLNDGVVSQDEFVSWLETTFPTAHQDPTREIFYSLDNEPDLWSETHSSIHPEPLRYDELLGKSIATAAAVKDVAPEGKVIGFVSYGYAGFTNLQNAPDAAGRDFTDYFLDGMRDAEETHGKRLMDVLDLHWYPEARGNNVRVMGEDTSAAVAQARMQAPRSLWDPSYVETSWITNDNGGQALRLIPSMKEKIAAHYPGTELAVTEYYYGGGSHISGGIAQADVLGIFGREGIQSAAMWPMTSDVPFITGGFAMFRSYDGAGGSFGDVSVQANNSDVIDTSVYASVDSATNKVVLVVINKASTEKVAALTISHDTAFSRAKVYQLTSASPTATPGADVVLSQQNALRYTMPAMSVSTLVLEP